MNNGFNNSSQKEGRSYKIYGLRISAKGAEVHELAEQFPNRN